MKDLLTNLYSPIFTPLCIYLYMYIFMIYIYMYEIKKARSTYYI